MPLIHTGTANLDGVEISTNGSFYETDKMCSSFGVLNPQRCHLPCTALSYCVVELPHPSSVYTGEAVSIYKVFSEVKFNYKIIRFVPLRERGKDGRSTGSTLRLFPSESPWAFKSCSNRDQDFSMLIPALLSPSSTKYGRERKWPRFVWVIQEFNLLCKAKIDEG